MIKDFEEKEIRNRILSKVNPQKINKNSPHWKGSIFINNILIGKVKIPNDHKRIMHKNKSQFIARDLKLSDDQFNDLIECPLTGKDYYNIIKDLI